MNLLDNPGFESGANPWAPVGPCTLRIEEDTSPEPRPDSTRCLMVTNRSADWNGPSFDMRTRGVPGRSYAVSVWVRTQAPEADPDAGPPPELEPQTFKLSEKRICASTDASPGYFRPMVSITAGPEWTELATEFVGHSCPNDDLQESLVYIEGPVIGVDFCIDDASIIPL